MNGSFLPCPKVIGLVKTSLRLSARCASSFTTWEKPHRGWTKLNFDASKTIENASIGGVYRDHDGCFMLGYAERIRCTTSSSVAELMACKRGLELALENGWMKIWIEGDAKVVTDLFSEKATLKALEDLRVAKEMSMLVPQLNGFFTSHVYRKGNRVAHEFAKLGSKFRKPRIWRGLPPKEVQGLLKQDVHGKS